MAKRRLVFESNSKRYFEGPDPGSLILNFREGEDGVGVLNHRLSEYFMQGMSSMGIATHFIKRLNMHESLIHHLEMIPVKMKVRMRADQTFAKDFDVEIGTVFTQPLVDFYFRNKEGELNVISQSHIISMGWANQEELQEVYGLIKRISDYLAGAYWSTGALLVDFNLELGRQYFDDYPPMLVVGDEVGPANTQLWDLQSETDGEIISLGVEEIADRLSLAPGQKNH